MKTVKATIDSVADYIILQLKDCRHPVNHLKLQKLLYYVQAWYLAFYKKPLFEGTFQAWVHGPVNRKIYDRFSDRGMYSDIELDSVLQKDLALKLPEDVRRHIDSVLEAYGQYSAVQLESLTHEEDPWIMARRGLEPYERCENPINEELMGSYYRQRLQA